MLRLGKVLIAFFFVVALASCQSKNVGLNQTITEESKAVAGENKATAKDSKTVTGENKTSVKSGQEYGLFEVWAYFTYGGDSLFVSVTNPATGKKDVFKLGPLLDDIEKTHFVRKEFAAEPGDFFYASLQTSSSSGASARIAVRHASAAEPPVHWWNLHCNANSGSSGLVDTLQALVGSSEWDKYLSFFESSLQEVPFDWYAWHGVTEGAAAEEVRALLGEPVKKEPAVENSMLVVWRYPDVAVYLDKNTNRVTTVTVSKETSVGGGIRSGSSYADLVGFWGQPLEIIPSIYSPKDGFLALYKNGSRQVTFCIYQGRISWIEYGTLLAD